MHSRLTPFLFALALAPTSLWAQVIDFEMLPAGGATIDQQQISNEYSTFGVTFSLLDPDTGLPSGFPRIAKAGAPQTAFEGCFAPDTPLPSVDLGISFLTDGTTLGIQGDLLIEYAVPVAQASGVILDIDCRVNGGPPCEQWTITAYDSVGDPLQVVVLDAPRGMGDPACVNPAAGIGDSQAFGWVVDVGTADISSIILKHTSNATNVGLAFDSFSVATLPGPPSVTALTSAGTICASESAVLSPFVTGGLPPYSYQWQVETSPGVWADLGTGVEQIVTPLTTTSYRVNVLDGQSNQDTSDPLEITVLGEDELCSASLLVSGNTSDSVVRYSFVSLYPEVFVTSGDGSLNGTSKLVCGPDGDLYVSSQDNDRVLRYDGNTGTFLEIFVDAGSGGLDIPIGLDFGPDGSLYVASFQTHSILEYDGTTGDFLGTFIPTGSGLNGPTGIVWGEDDNLYISSFNGDKVLRFDSTGTFIDDFVTAGSGGLDAPRGLIFGPDGKLYVAEQYQHSVSRYDGTTGAFIDVFVSTGSGGLSRANDVAFGPDGILYVVSYNNDLVLRFDPVTGDPLGALPDPDGLLNGPAWLAVGCAPYPTNVGWSPPSSNVGLDVEYPNGAGGPVSFRLELEQAAIVNLAVYDLRGRLVTEVARGSYGSGIHEVLWKGDDDRGSAVARGVYFARVTVGPGSRPDQVARKFVLLH